MTAKDQSLERLKLLNEKALKGGGENATLRQKGQGKGTARERIETLLDPQYFGELIDLEPMIVMILEWKRRDPWRRRCHGVRAYRWSIGLPFCS